MKTRTHQTDEQVRQRMLRDIKIIRDELRCAVEDMNTNQWESVAVLMNQIAGLAYELRAEANQQHHADCFYCIRLGKENQHQQEGN